MALYGLSVLISVVCAVIGAFDTANTGLYLGTAGLTLLLAGLFFGIQPNLYKRNSRFATLLTMGVAVLAWLCLILLIWNTKYPWFDPRTTRKMGISFLALFPAVFMIAGSMAIFRANWKGTGWTLLIGFAVVTLLIDKGADVMAVDPQGFGVVHWLLELKENDESGSLAPIGSGVAENRKKKHITLT